MNLTAMQALDRLREGNRRFASGVVSLSALATHLHLPDLVAGQDPWAVVLGCSDSRVPVEMVFDQGLGDLFVIRIAGNVVASSQIASVEYAAEHSGARLAVVLGHTCCGAVRAALEELRQPPAEQSPGLRSIVSRIRPSVEDLLQTELRHDPEALARSAVRANVRTAANQLRNGSKILERLIRDDGLLVVGAVYALETGAVEFFDGVPT